MSLTWPEAADDCGAGQWSHHAQSCQYNPATSTWGNVTTRGSGISLHLNWPKYFHASSTTTLHPSACCIAIIWNGWLGFLLSFSDVEVLNCRVLVLWYDKQSNYCWSLRYLTFFFFLGRTFYKRGYRLDLGSKANAQNIFCSICSRFHSSYCNVSFLFLTVIYLLVFAV